MKIKKFLKPIFTGIAVGVVNGTFGAGGGMIAVPLLKRHGLNQKLAQSNAIAIILPITIISAILYILKGNVALTDSFGFIPTGILGSVIATFALEKFSNKILQKTFGIFMIYAGFRLLTR